MTEQVIIVKKDNNVSVVEQTTKVTVAAMGSQGAKGDQGSTGSSGPQGPQGPQGSQGVPGNPELISFSYEKQSNATQWSIVHNLGYRPAVYTQDYARNVIEGEVLHTDINSLVVNFNNEISGYAYLS